MTVQGWVEDSSSDFFLRIELRLVGSATMSGSVSGSTRGVSGGVADLCLSSKPELYQTQIYLVLKCKQTISYFSLTYNILHDKIKFLNVCFYLLYTSKINLVMEKNAKRLTVWSDDRLNPFRNN